jgi:hypothetical protein
MVPEASLPDGFPAPGPVGMVLVKHYPACREARVESADGEGDSMFMSLFNHIKTNDIPMTAPVEMIWDKSATTQPAKPVAMAFVYGKPTTGKTGVDGKVHVIDLPAQTVISIGVRGGYDEKHFTPALAALKDFLADQSDRYEQTGPPRYLGYNSPFVPPFMRYGEVQLPIAVLK